MEITANSTQYLNYQALAQSGPTSVGAGQEVPSGAADPATAPPQTAASAAPATGPTPSSQFSSDTLAQLIQAQTDPGQASQTQGVHGRRGHHHHGGGGAPSAAPASNPTGMADAAGVTDPSLASADQDQALPASLMS